MTINILIADDHGVLRAGLRALLNAENDMKVLGEAGDGEEALRLAAELQPDILLLDIGMPKLTGIQVARRLKEQGSRMRVLILTLHEDENFLKRAIENGAAGYVVKRAVDTELISAIRAVARGEMYIHPAMTRALLNDLAPEHVPAPAPKDALSPREREVLKLFAQGYTNPQIAERLKISVRTVEGHRTHIANKLNLTSPVQLVRYAMEHGLIE